MKVWTKEEYEKFINDVAKIYSEKYNGSISQANLSTFEEEVRDIFSQMMSATMFVFDKLGEFVRNYCSN
ncbi:MAG: hypothetical protein LBD32_02550 [Cytophagales bacterium]|jgi:hypothetical protein|nr:hypothetical protein [Cytophagales bacterium]